MKGFTAFVLVLLLGLAGYNWWQIQGLRQEIARLEQKVNQPSVSDQAIAQAAAALDRVQRAVRATDWNTARATYEEARAKVNDVARAAGDMAGPTIDRLKAQTAELGRQLQQRMPGGR
jgi:hypothetical protein